MIKEISKQNLKSIRGSVYNFSLCIVPEYKIQWSICNCPWGVVATWHTALCPVCFRGKSVPGCLRKLPTQHYISKEYTAHNRQVRWTWDTPKLCIPSYCNAAKWPEFQRYPKCKTTVYYCSDQGTFRALRFLVFEWKMYSEYLLLVSFFFFLLYSSCVETI